MLLAPRPAGRAVRCVSGLAWIPPEGNGPQAWRLRELSDASGQVARPIEPRCLVRVNANRVVLCSNVRRDRRKALLESRGMKRATSRFKFALLAAVVVSG